MELDGVYLGQVHRDEWCLFWLLPCDVLYRCMDLMFGCHFSVENKLKHHSFPFLPSPHHCVCICIHVPPPTYIYSWIWLKFSLQHAHSKRQGQCSSWSNWSWSNSEGRNTGQWCSPQFLYPATNLGTLSQPPDLQAASRLLTALFQSPSPMQRPTQTWSCPSFSYTKCSYLGSCSHKITVSSVFVAVQSLNCVRLFVTPWTAACQASLSFTISPSLLKLMSIESVMLSNHLILCHPLLLLPSMFPTIRVFSNESAVCIR